MCFTKLCIFWNIALIYEFVGLCIGKNTGPGAAPQPRCCGAKTNYNWFYIFQNCIIYRFGRIYWIARLSCFIILWDLVNFCRWNPDLTQMEFLWFCCDKWPIIRLLLTGALCKNVYFLRFQSYSYFLLDLVNI